MEPELRISEPKHFGMREVLMHRRGFTAVELVLVIVVLAIVVTVTLVQVDKRRQARLRAESAENLRVLQSRLSTSMQELSADINSPQVYAPRVYAFVWPPPSRTSPRLLPEMSETKVQDLVKSDILFAFISPAHPEAERMRNEVKADPGSLVRDDSYWYLGYALPNEEAGLAFVEAYREAVEKTGKPPTGDIELLSPITMASPPPSTSKPQQPSHKPTITVSRLSTIHLRVDQNSSVSRARVRPSVPRWMYQLAPMFIERPGLQRGGSNVLFVDGTVRFMKYPGEFPMTEKFIKALESLDELKEKK